MANLTNCQRHYRRSGANSMHFSAGALKYFDWKGGQLIAGLPAACAADGDYACTCIRRCKFYLSRLCGGKFSIFFNIHYLVTWKLQNKSRCKKFGFFLPEFYSAVFLRFNPVTTWHMHGTIQSSTEITGQTHYHDH